MPKNGSVPTFTRIRKTSQSDRFQPSLGTIKAQSRGDFGSNSDVRTCENRKSRSGSIGSKYSDDFVSRHPTYFWLKLKLNLI